MKRHLCYATTLLVSLGITACSPERPAPYDEQTAVCAANAFLQKYNCSLNAVEQAAQKGDPDAEYALGYMYYNGIDTQKDVPTARVWIRRAAEQGQPMAIKAQNILQKTAYPTMGEAHMKSVKKHVRVAVPVGAERKVAPTASKMAAPVKAAAVSAAVTPSNLSTVAPTHYTIQLMGSHSADKLSAFIQANEAAKGAVFYERRLNGQPWYVLILGDYASKQAAVDARNALPQSLRRMHPWVKTYASVQRELIQ